MRYETPSEEPRPTARWRRELVRNESGQSLILITLAMFLFLGIAALAIDAAQLSVAHHQAQVAADAAALSAAQDMETTTTPASTVTTDGKTAGTTNDPNATVTISASGVNAQAQVTAPVSLPFGKAFGFGSGSVSAQSVATVSTATTNIDGQVLSINCAGDNTTPCEYGSGAIVPTTNQTTGWQVTDKAEDPTTNGPPSGSGYTAGETTVNIQTCNGTTGNGSCYVPNSTSADEDDSLTQVVDLNGDSEGGMWQTVATIPHAKYVLTFWLTGNPALNGWPAASDNHFPVDVYVTSGSGSSAQYSPSVTQSVQTAGSTPVDVCTTATQPSNYVACGWWDYQDPVCNGSTATTASGLKLSCSDSGQEEAAFTVESLSFTATSSETTITFNSEVYDNNVSNWFNCGPEVADIDFGPPAIQLTQ